MKSYAVEGADYVDGSWVQEETGKEHAVKVDREIIQLQEKQQHSANMSKISVMYNIIVNGMNVMCA